MCSIFSDSKLLFFFEFVENYAWLITSRTNSGYSSDLDLKFIETVGIDRELTDSVLIVYSERFQNSTLTLKFIKKYIVGELFMLLLQSAVVIIHLTAQRNFECWNILCFNCILFLKISVLKNLKTTFFRTHCIQKLEPSPSSSSQFAQTDCGGGEIERPQKILVRIPICNSLVLWSL